MNAQKRPPIPTHFDLLYPGRFMKAGELGEGTPTYEIEWVGNDRLLDENDVEKLKTVVWLKGQPRQWIACVTNGQCLRAMFGVDPRGWVGKRVMLFQSEWKKKPCIRVYGSPDIDAEREVTIELPRRKPYKMKMHTTPKAPQATARPRAPMTMEQAAAVLRGSGIDPSDASRFLLSLNKDPLPERTDDGRAAAVANLIGPVRKQLDAWLRENPAEATPAVDLGWGDDDASGGGSDGDDAEAGSQ